MVGKEAKECVVCLLEVTSSKLNKHKLSSTNPIVTPPSIGFFFYVNNGTPIELINA
jgi:hypothetical protein